MKKHLGFTMIELVIVLAILVLLAFYAVPKFMSIDKTTRTTEVKSLASTAKSASEMVRAVVVSKGDLADSTVDIEYAGENIAVAVDRGYAKPTKDGIVKALDITVQDASTTPETPGDYTVTTTANSITIVPTETKDGANCSVTYKYAATDSKPVITSTVKDCS